MNDARFSRPSSWPAALLPGIAVIVFIACSGSDKAGGVADAKLPQGTRSGGLDHEDCSEAGHRVDVLDTNGDGKPDIRRIFDKGTGREICRVADLNHDGKPDLYEYFDASGTIRRREYCYDDTGVVNAVEVFESGKLVRREYDTTGQHKIDTWDTFDPNAPVDPKVGRPAHPIHRERDTTGNGRPNQWWTWDGSTVTIAYDRDGDGKPDPENTVVLGGGDDAGGPPPPAPATQDAGSEAGVSAAASTASAADGGKP